MLCSQSSSLTTLTTDRSLALQAALHIDLRSTQTSRIYDWQIHLRKGLASSAKVSESCKFPIVYLDIGKVAQKEAQGKGT